MNNPFINLLVSQLRRFYREPESVFWALFFPIMITCILSAAFSGENKKVQALGIVKDEGSCYIDIIRLIESRAQGRFNIRVVDQDEATKMVKKGIFPIYIEVMDKDSITYRFDPSNPDGNLTYLTLEKLVNGTDNGALKSTVTPLSSTGARYIDFLIPGLIAMGMMNGCIWGIGWNFIELRIRRLLKRMAASPMRRRDFLAAHFIARYILVGIEASILYIFAHYLFGVTISGSIAALAIIFISGNLAFCGIGLIIAARTSTNQMGLGLINTITTMTVVLSGIFFNYHNFPDWAARIISYLPLTMLADSIRSVFNESATILDIAVKSSILFTFGLLLSWVGLKIFKWQ